MCQTLINEWEESLLSKDKSKYTIKNYISDIGIYFNWIKEYKKLNEVTLSEIKKITTQDLERFIIHLKQKGQSEASRVRRARAIINFYKFVEKTLGEIKKKENPTLDWELPSVKPKPMPYLTVEESRLAMNNIYGENSVRDKAIMGIFLNTGIRVSELQGLNMNDVQKVMTVLGKGNKTRDVNLNQKTMEVINDWLEVRHKYLKSNKDEPALFLSERGNRISIRAIQHLVKKVYKRIGRTDCTTHSTRHSALSMMLKNGTDLMTVKDIAGHAMITTTQRYLHTDNEQKQAAVDSIDIY